VTGTNDFPAAFAARVEAVEPEAAFLDLACAGHELVVRLPPHDLPAVGDTVHLGYAAERKHFFDPATGQRQEPPGAAGLRPFPGLWEPCVAERVTGVRIRVPAPGVNARGPAILA
jgi:hypothetical protein